MKELTEPIRLMIRTDLLDPGHPNSLMSCESQRLLSLCRKMKIKWEEHDHCPYDRVWITLRTMNQKIAVIKFFGIDRLIELAEKQNSEKNA